MYPSGRWEGFWVAKGWGRGPMSPLTLRFDRGEVTGEGQDDIGRFTFAGAYDLRTGRVLMVKQYLGKHAVRYEGAPDGEGSIQGTWSIGPDWSGPFLLRPVVRKPTGGEPIQDIG